MTPSAENIEMLGLKYDIAIQDLGQLALVTFTIDEAVISVVTIKIDQAAYQAHPEEVNAAATRLAFWHLRHTLSHNPLFRL